MSKMEENIQKVCFSPSGFNMFLSVLRTMFGSAGDSILFNMARDFGMHDTKQMLESLEQDADQKDERAIISMLLDSIGSLGWGNHRVEKFDLMGGEIVFEVSENPTIDLCDTGESPQCYFMKGVLSGMIKEVTEIDFQPSSHSCRDENKVCRLYFTRQ